MEQWIETIKQTKERYTNFDDILQNDETLIYYDIPLAFITHDKDGVKYFYLCIELSQEFVLALLVKDTDNARIKDVIDNKIYILDYIKNGELLLCIMDYNNRLSFYKTNFDDFPTEYLPVPNCYLSF